MLAWLKTRKRILQQIKKRVAEHFLKESKELQEYRKEYEQGFRRRYQATDLEELVREIHLAQVIFGGDFHAFSQAQRTHLKILRRFKPTEKVTIALEATSHKKNQIVERFLRNEIS